MVASKNDSMVSSGKFRSQSIAYMGLTNAVHMGCYECARSATTALFTSDRVGFTSASALPLATGLVSPCSILLFWFHRRVFDTYGPQRALFTTTLVYSIILLAAAVILGEDSGFPRRCCQVTIVLLFVTKNSLVHLVMAQHWSFLTSLLGPTKAAQSSVWAGVASLVATGAAGGLVGPVVARVGLTGLLAVAAMGLLLVTIGGDVAYRVANQHNFAPIVLRKMDEKKQRESLPRRAIDLFRRIPLLGALCTEVLLAQSLSSLLSYMFISVLQDTISDDGERATYTGRVYARINVGTMMVQWGILPLIVSALGPHRTSWLWLGMPAILLVPMLQVVSNSQSLSTVVPALFGLLKTLEYALRGTLAEVAYGSIPDDASRFLGKEIISVVANRCGKSATAGVLAVIPPSPQNAPSLLLALVVLWGAASWRLVQRQLLLAAKTPPA